MLIRLRCYEERDFSIHLIQSDSGCYFDLTYDTTMSIDDRQTLSDKVQFYPNPAQNEIRLSFNTPTSAPSHLVITDALGRTIKELTFKKGTSRETIALKGYASGMYYLNLWQQKQHSVQKFVLIPPSP